MWAFPHRSLWITCATAEGLARGLLSSGAIGQQIEVFRKRIGELGYVEGNNLRIETRSAEGNYRRCDACNELINLDPDVIVAEATPAIAAVQKLTVKIPIVMATVTDPIGSGFAKSFSPPWREFTALPRCSVIWRRNRLIFFIWCCRPS